MKTVLRRKLNSTLTSILSFEVDEWNAIDFSDSPVKSTFKQGDTSVLGSITYDEVNYRVIIEHDLAGFAVGPAEYDVKIGDAPVPSNYNIRVDLIEGVT